MHDFSEFYTMMWDWIGYAFVLVIMLCGIAYKIGKGSRRA